MGVREGGWGAKNLGLASPLPWGGEGYMVRGRSTRTSFDLKKFALAQPGNPTNTQRSDLEVEGGRRILTHSGPTS